MRSLSHVRNLLLTTLCIVGLICIGTTTAQSQSNPATGDVPRTLSYQGLLSNPDGTPVIDGEYTITVSLYGDSDGRKKIWQGSYRTAVVNGIFNLYLGSEDSPLPNPTIMNMPLWIGTQVGDTPEMYPLTPLSASPYALNVPDNSITNGKLAAGSVTADKVSMNYVSNIAVNGQPVTGQGTALNIVGSADIALTYNDQTNTLQLGRSTPRTGDAEKGASTLDATDGSQNWKGRTNLTDPLVFAGPVGSYNTLVGGASNTIGSESEYSAIVGGRSNDIGESSNYNFIGGGERNYIDAFHSVIAGGDSNTVEGANSAIVAGSGNLITGNNSTIAGGGQWNARNTINGNASFIGAGNVNTIEFSEDNAIVTGSSNTIHEGVGQSIIGSGVDNQIHDNTAYSFVGSGLENQIMGDVTSNAIGSGEYNTISASNSFIGSGEYNTISASNSFIGSGSANTVSASNSSISSGSYNRVAGVYSAIGGGQVNVIDSNSAFSFIGGGITNSIAHHTTSGVIGGGELNSIGTSYWSTIAGGHGNSTTANHNFIGGGHYNSTAGSDAAIVGGRENKSNGQSSFVGGGDSNIASNQYSFVGGGRKDTASGEYAAVVGGQSNSASASHDFIGGGKLNITSKEYAVITGGEGNDASGEHSFIGGGYYNIASGRHAVIAGGVYNVADGIEPFIGGGVGNMTFGEGAFIGGGTSNIAMDAYAVSAGGQENHARGSHSAIGGGLSNSAIGRYSTIPGGDSLLIAGYAQTAIGFYNASRGSQILQPTTLELKTMNDPLFMVGNGSMSATGSIDHSNAFEVSYNGHSVVYDVNGTGSLAVPGSRAPIKGATYVDNVIYAWGDISANGTVNSDFGVASVVNAGLGVYIVTIRAEDPQTGLPITLPNAAIVATLSEESDIAPCGTIICSRLGSLGANRFRVRTWGPDCTPRNIGFMFHLTGRP